MSIFESVKYEFGPNELRALGMDLARATAQVYELEAEKKAVAARFAGEIKRANKQVSEITTKLNNGYELRDVAVRVVMDLPREGMKSIFRTDTQELLREEVMTPEERQRPLEMGNPAKVQ